MDGKAIITDGIKIKIIIVAGVKTRIIITMVGVKTIMDGVIVEEMAGDFS